MINYQTNNNFFAQGLYHSGQKSVPVQLTGNYKSFSDDPVDIQVWSEENDAIEVFDSSMRYPYSIWFDGKTEMGESLWMMGIRPYQITGSNHLDGSVDIFIKGNLEATSKPNQTIHVHAITSQSPVILPEWRYIQSYDGTTTRLGDEVERNGINWENNQGKAKLIDYYEFVNADKNDRHTSIKIRTNSLFLTIIPIIETEIKAILFQLPRFLYEDLNLLSFIGRKRIVCTEATARISDDNSNSYAYARYRTWGGFYNLPSEQNFLRPLIHPRLLQQGVFSNLISTYKASPYKKIIDRTIPYILTSYEDGYVETHLVNAYAALESMVDGIGSFYEQDHLLGKRSFKHLSSKIKDLITQEILDIDIANGISKKIPELNRRSFLDRLLFLLNIQGVNTSLVWPPNIDESKEFQEIITRRNLLIHTGLIDRGDLCDFDLNRVQKLVEIWILKLLDCPDEKVNLLSLYRDAPINKILHY
ncbi:MAG: hypothetical protein C3F13_08275 [Anaerolineales bacterium]|nr:MAG: hypothetical protein C3F13_08275 [Anaerolineales bacterium]